MSSVNDEMVTESTVESLWTETLKVALPPGSGSVVGLASLVTVIEDGTVDWRNAYRNDSRAAPLAVSLQMSKGAAGNVLTWTGSIALIEQPTIEYMDGVGYVTLVGEFVSDDADPCLTLTQS